MLNIKAFTVFYLTKLSDFSLFAAVALAASSMLMSSFKVFNTSTHIMLMSCWKLV